MAAPLRDWLRITRDVGVVACPTVAACVASEFFLKQREDIGSDVFVVFFVLGVELSWFMKVCRYYTPITYTRARQGQIQYKQSFQQAQLRWICSFHQRAETAGHVAVVGRTQPPGPFRRVCFVVLVSCFYRWETGCQKKNLRPCQNSTLLFGGWDRIVVFDTWDLQVFVATLIWVPHNTLFLGRSCDLSSLPQLLKRGTWTFGKEYL